MDTVLNLGLNETNLPVVAKEYGWRFALDCMRRLLDMFGDVVLGMPHELFEAELQAVKDAAGIKFDVDLGEDDLRAVVQRFRGVRGPGQVDAVGSVRAAGDGHLCRLRQLAHASGGQVPGDQPHYWADRDSGQHPDDGVWQPQRYLGDGSLLYA